MIIWDRSTRREAGSGRGRPGTGWFSLWSPVAVIVIGTVLDAVTPPPYQFQRFLSAAPALAAVVWPVSGTLAIGGCAVVAEIGLALAKGTLGTAPRLFTLAVTAVVTLAAAYGCAARLRNERLVAELTAVADAAQSVVLRRIPERLGRVEVATLYVAAAAQARVGGDFYEVLHTPYGVRALIGDVRGKGLRAVGAAATLTASFREAAYDAADLVELAGRLETSAVRYSDLQPDRDDAERFATALLVEVPDDEPVARLVSCGHPEALLLRDGRVRVLEPTLPSPPLLLGAVAGIGYHVDTTELRAGDQLLLYTDGVSETRDRSGDFYPLPERVRPWTAVPPRRVLARLHEDLIAYSASGLDDDVAAVAIRAFDTRTEASPEERSPQEAGVPG
ncbi:PP2C family protein-serine/threonine phosphatase [Streptantibioticus parmotrematis]|uniref:PP2C family protein-serine/threonine phosphatase n=1 Tax=Streptantibioticus parmotrematis TaxID=2873249 RepID=UPI003401D61C